MRRSQRTTTAAVVAGAAALALAATGIGAGPSAAQPGGTDGPATATTRPAAPGDGAGVTLITGDHVVLDGRGKVARLLPAEGREAVPVQISEIQGHTYVLPSDTAGLIATGKLDRRLFDVTELSRPEYRRLVGDGVPLLVTYTGSGPRSAARGELRADTGATVRAEIDTVAGEALTVPAPGTGAAWAALTSRSAQGHRLAAGIRSVRLDGLVTASLDRSVPQIGAPDAWHAGYDGTGVKVAVLDTGIDTRHADLAPQVVAEKNFTDAPDVSDHYGHGTHVASTIAGTGAASQGRYKGVAPGVRLINGKVLDDRGAGTESSIIAGMEWAVDQGATIVNLSLGGGDTLGVDPVEETVDRLSDRALFVIAAGNEGPGPSTLGTPGTADRALTVGAVDQQDTLANFSSRGPRIGDSALKPDLTAPGVDITAAAAEGSRIDTAPGTPHPAPGYLTMSGTSMATPHVSGAAALLSQQHPDWSGTRIKDTLVGSARPGPYSAVEQGAGRVDLTRAVVQDVVAEPASLSFGAPLWPHADDRPVTKTLTYRNGGTEAVTLDLTATATGPARTPAPDGFFTLGARQVTVPAGGTASVDVTADPRLGGETLGVYSLAVTASTGKRSVRTAGALNLEGEMYELTLNATARDGSAPGDGDWSGYVYDLDHDTMTAVSGDHGTARLRLPRGTYTIIGEVPLLSPELVYIGDDFVSAPRLLLDKDTTLPVDARRTKLIDLAAPDPDASYSSGFVTLTPDGAPGPIALYIGNLSEGFRTQQVGPRPAPGTVSSHIVATFVTDTATFLLADKRDDGFYTGRRVHPTWDRLAKITSRQGASVTGRTGVILSTPDNGLYGSTYTGAPETVTTYLQTGRTWQRTFQQLRGGRTVEVEYPLPARTYRGGKEYAETFNTGVFGPALAGRGSDTGRGSASGPGTVNGPGSGLVRDGDRLTGSIRPFTDGAGHDGESLYDTASASTTLYRDGDPYATVQDPLDTAGFDLPKERARYRLVTTVGRAKSGVATVGTEVSWSAEFTSGRTAKPTSIPSSVVRYTPRLALDGTAPAGARLRVPVTVQGSAAGHGLASLAVYGSYDRGATWSPLTVRDGAVTVVNPAAGGSVSFKAEIKDRDKGVFTQTLLDAYRTR
ncbi:S8 family peptidase [Streptomyces sp. SID1121]|uniref:S8 family peptidase n=1 Tax=Streptomyces sp. SID1121 TaxID=3425888 RepID=UPI0040572102